MELDLSVSRREFVWGGFAGAFGEGMMHSVDTLKTRLQSQAIIAGHQGQKNILQMIRTVWAADGLKGFYRGITPGVTGSLATGATYFGVIESTKLLLEEVNPNLSGHWSHFIAGAIGDTLGSVVYVPCEVIKQRMQVQGSRTSWSSMLMKESATQNSGVQIYDYYTGIFQAGHSIWKQHGLKGLYAGYNGWLDALTSIWETEGLNGMFKGSIPRILWYIPASALSGVPQRSVQ